MCGKTLIVGKFSLIEAFLKKINNSRFIRQILLSDEASLCINGIINRQNCRYLGIREFSLDDLGKHSALSKSKRMDSVS